MCSRSRRSLPTRSCCEIPRMTSAPSAGRPICSAKHSACSLQSGARSALRSRLAAFSPAGLPRPHPRGRGIPRPALVQPRNRKIAGRPGRRLLQCGCPRRPLTDRLTSTTASLRLHGRDRMYASNYSDDDLTRLAARFGSLKPAAHRRCLSSSTMIWADTLRAMPGS